MSIMINIKVDPRMREAIKKAAEKQFISMSAFIKQAVEKHLQDQGIDWRKEPEKKGKRSRE
jgi:predicted HicB family RNase H-like nuclease